MQFLVNDKGNKRSADFEISNIELTLKEKEGNCPAVK